MHITGKELTEILHSAFQDKTWFVNVVLQGACLMLLCPLLIGIPFLNGFVIMHTKRGITGEAAVPSWNDWNQYWTLGWRSLGVSLLYYLPLLGLFGLYLLIILIPITMGIVVDQEAIALIGSIISIAGMVIIYPLMFVYMILYLAIQMAASAKIANGASFAAASNWRQYLWPYIKVNAVNMLVVYVIVYLISMVATLGMLALFIGILFTMPLAVATMAYSYGLIYRLSSVK